jgi:hypothetical protein
MTITVFRDIEKCNDLTSMFLDINGQEYTLYHRENNVLLNYDIAIDTPTDTYPEVNYKIFLQLDIWDNFENQGWANANNSRRDMYAISNAWDPNYESDKIIYNDFLFNRTKAYYQNYAFSQSTKLWYYQDRSAYSIPTQDVNLKTKIFIGPNKTWPLELQSTIYQTDNYQERNIKYRPKIFQKLVELENLGHIGNSHVNKQYFLIPHFVYPNFCAVTELHLVSNRSKLVDQSIKTSQLNYSPPHNAYYEDTFISIYGETIEYGTTIAPTEKTYDPLIKGHFILPFSCSGFIKFLRNKGFWFPEFIDYSYDEIVNDEKRFECYLKEVDRLLGMSLDNWQQHWVDNAEIRRHNQTVFETTPYDRVNLHQLINFAKNP